MKNWENVTLGDIGRGLVRYRPFIALAVAILVAMTVLAGTDGGDNSEVATGPAARTGGTLVAGDTTEATTPEGEAIDPATGQPASGARTGGRSAGRTGSAGGAGGPSAGQPVAVPDGSVSPNCDPKTDGSRCPPTTPRRA